jgi:hypothetical protein
MQILSSSAWQARAAAHGERVRPWVEPRLHRRSVGGRHPVDDFLFDYYPFRAGQLARWHPGLGVGLEDGAEYLDHKGYRSEGGITWADPALFPPSRQESVRWLEALLRVTADRPPTWGCFGMHEWAMVYRADTVRHAAWPLRLSAETIARVVDALGLRCTHYDALRFFTPSAGPLNKLQPTRATAAEFEQPGCLHANMDLYKWAFKLVPYAPSELVADCFALAREIRLLDMRASPYDLTTLQLAPVRIETPSGRAEYEAAQREFSVRAVPLRARLRELCEKLISAFRPAESASMVEK